MSLLPSRKSEVLRCAAAVLRILLRVLRKQGYGALRWIFDPALICRQMAVIATLQFVFRIRKSVSKHVMRLFYKMFKPQIYDAMKRLDSANTYPDYKQRAEELDALFPSLQAWKATENVLLYDIRKMKARIERYEVDPQTECETYDLMFELRTSLLRKQFGLASPKLYKGYTSSTKKVVERYMSSVLRALRTCAKSIRVPVADRLHFLRETRQSFGRTALLLSGGCSLGTYHFGVIKGLAEIGILPRIVSGSSAGAIMAAWLAVQTAEDLRRWCENPVLGDVAILCFHGAREEETIEKMEATARKMYAGEGFFNMDAIKQTMINHVGATTMLEAYEKTGRIVNIVVSSEDGVPFLINYLTAPHVFLWSAVCASTSIPGAFQSVELRAKNRRGEDVPYERTGTRWRDGSFTADLPRKRLSELFNVNHYIVSQVAPHWTFFGELPENSGFFGKFMNFVFEQVKYSFLSVDHVIPSRFHPLALITQDGVGDITIRPTESIRTSLASILRLLVNPADTLPYIKESERQVWKLSTRLHLVCAVEMLMDTLIQELQQESLACGVKERSQSCIAIAKAPPESPIPGERSSSMVHQSQMASLRRQFSTGRLFSTVSPDSGDELSSALVQ